MFLFKDSCFRGIFTNGLPSLPDVRQEYVWQISQGPARRARPEVQLEVIYKFPARLGNRIRWYFLSVLYHGMAFGVPVRAM